MNSKLSVALVKIYTWLFSYDREILKNLVILCTHMLVFYTPSHTYICLDILDLHVRLKGLPDKNLMEA